MSKATKPQTDETTNPLWAYSVAVETLISIATGKSKSPLRLQAALALLERCGDPPLLDWGIEFDDD